jgi:Na+-driven multidrug efflux pump
VVVSGVGFVLVVILGVALVRVWGAEGAAVAAVISESVLAVLSFSLLWWRRPATRISLGFVWRPAVAGGVAALMLLVPGLPTGATAVIAAVVFALVALAVRAVPEEVLEAMHLGRLTALATRRS